jgi:arsenate reductase (thioredoxin)
VTRILFVCVGNSARSQMAEAFCRELGRNVECASAGSQPAPNVQHDAVAVMGEAGIDISKASPKALDAVLPGKWDYVVTMGCEVDCPFIPGAKVVSWEIPDPRGKPLAEYRRARDMIRTEVESLLSRLAGAPKDSHPV